ncbi:MAG: PAS domain S-box protein [Sphingobacteriia bacterium]|nr:PAS domain S-box protein [Sphingobacteriia bacterium]
MSDSQSTGDKLATAIAGTGSYFVIQISLNGQYLYANPYFESVFVEEGDSAVGKPYTFGLLEEDFPAVGKVVTDCINDPGKSKPIILRKFAQGHYFLTFWEFTCATDQAGQPDSIICIGHNITESEKQQIRTEYYLHQINEYLNSITDGFFTLNKNWEFVRVNDVFEQIAGKSKAELVGSSFWDSFDENTKEPYAQAIKFAMENNDTVRFEQFWPPDRYYSAAIFPSSEGLICYIRDITNKKKQEFELRDSQIKLRAILNSTVDSNTLISADLKVINFNRAAEEQSRLYYNRELVAGEDFLHFVPPHLLEKFKTNFSTALKGGTVKSEELIKVYNGDSVWVEFLYYPVLDDEKNLLGVVINSTIIDKRKRAELKVKTQYEQLKKIAHMQSHELRAPLTNIMGVVNVLNMLKQKVNDPEIIELLNTLAQSTSKMDSIIKQIVEATRE